MMREAVAHAARAPDAILFLLALLLGPRDGARERVRCHRRRQAEALRCHGCAGQPLLALLSPHVSCIGAARRDAAQAAAFSVEEASIVCRGQQCGCVAHGRALELG